MGDFGGGEIGDFGGGEIGDFGGGSLEQPRRWRGARWLGLGPHSGSAAPPQSRQARAEEALLQRASWGTMLPRRAL